MNALRVMPHPPQVMVAPLIAGRFAMAPSLFGLEAWAALAKDARPIAVAKVMLHTDRAAVIFMAWTWLMDARYCVYRIRKIGK